MTVDQATHAQQCCQTSALRQLSAADLAALDRWCARALDNPDAEPIGDEKAAAVARYERVLHAAAVGVWRRERQANYGRQPVAP